MLLSADNYQGVQAMDYTVEGFIDDVRNKYDPLVLSKGRGPLWVSGWWPWHDCRDSYVDILYRKGASAPTALLHPVAYAFLNICYHYISQYNLPLRGRYVYINGSCVTLRPGSLPDRSTAGWRRGPLSEERRPSFSFVWCSSLPSEYFINPVDGINAEDLSATIESKRGTVGIPYNIYLVNDYHVRRCVVPRVPTNRSVFMLTFSETEREGIQE